MAVPAPGAEPAEIVTTVSVYSLEEVSRACHVEVSWLAELAEHGVIEPMGTAASQARFSSVSLVRVAKAKRLRQDLGLNAAGIALALDLLSEIDRLRERLKGLETLSITNGLHDEPE